VEKWQEERFEFVRRMSLIFVAVLARVCSREGDSYGYGAIGKFY